MSGVVFSLSVSAMDIQVKTITGKVITQQVSGDDTILKLKEELVEPSGATVDQQRLIFNGEQLKEEKKISDYNIKDGSTLHLVLRLRG